MEKLKKLGLLIKKLGIWVYRYRSVSIPVIVMMGLLVSWIFVPCFIEYWLGDKERTRFEILTYIGAIGTGLILLGRLYEFSRRNEISQKSIELTEKSNMDIRFKDAATLLGNKDTSSVFAGIFALHQIAIDCTAQKQRDYINIIQDIFSAKIREYKINDPLNPNEDYDTTYPFVLKTIINLLVKTDYYVIMNYLDLNGANLGGVDLGEANLRKANLRRVNLSKANLRKANLSGANLDGADLSRAMLSGANLQGANLYKAILSGIFSHGANLGGAMLDKANLSGAILHGANLSRASLSEANLREAFLGEKYKIGDALVGTPLGGANLSGAKLSGANLSGAKLSGADLRGADLSGANLSNTDLSGADLRGAMLSGKYKFDGILIAKKSNREYSSGANLYNANLYKANLSEADLSEADLSKADLKGAILTRAQLPLKYKGYIEKFETEYEGALIYV